MQSPPSSNLPLAPSNGGDIAKNLPWEILESICNCSEDVNIFFEVINRRTSDRHFGSHPVPLWGDELELAAVGIPSASQSETLTSIPLEKLQKNKLILSMSHVCQSWRISMVGLKCLWRDIAFVGPVGVRLAMLFLTKVKDDNVPLRIYAKLPFDGFLNPIIAALLVDLRQHTHRWETFIYFGRLGPYRTFLDLPAPRLQYFSDHHDLSHLYAGRTSQLFAGCTPILRSLVTSSLRSWDPASLTNLRVLDLWDCDEGLSIRSLLSVLRRVPRLEEFNIISPNPPLPDYLPGEVVDLPHLKALKVKNPDFYAIIGPLSVPNVEAVTISAVHDHRAPAIRARPPFTAPHPFVGLASMTSALPMFGRPIRMASLMVLPVRGSGFVLMMSVITEGDVVLSVDLQWTGNPSLGRWRGYIQRSFSALAEMPFLSGAELQIKVPVHDFVDYTDPLFHLKAIEYLVVEGESLSTLVAALFENPAQRLPNLKLLSIPRDEDLCPFFIQRIPNFLRVRRNLVMAFNPHARNQERLVELLSRGCVFGDCPALIPGTGGAYGLIYVHLGD